MKKLFLRTMLLTVLMALGGASSAWAAEVWDFTNSSIWSNVALPTAESNEISYNSSGESTTTGNFVTFHSSTEAILHASTATNGIAFSSTGSTEDNYISLVVPVGSAASVTAYVSDNRNIQVVFKGNTDTFSANWADVTKSYDNTSGEEAETLIIYCSANPGNISQAPYLKKISLAQAVPVTINYKDTEDNTIKASVVEYVETGTSYTPNYLSTYYVSDTDPYVYTYLSGGETQTITAATTINIIYSKGDRATHTVTINKEYGENVVSTPYTVYDGASLTYYYPRFVLDGTTLYKYSSSTDTNASASYWTSSLSNVSADATYTLSYSQIADNCVYYKEAEDIEGVTLYNNSTYISRSSNGGIGVFSENTFTALEPGKYTITARVIGRASRSVDFYAGSVEGTKLLTVESATTGGEATSSEFTIAENTDIVGNGGYNTTSNNGHGVDYIYILQTGAADDTYYTIKFVDGGGNSLKDDVVAITKVGATITATDEQMAAFIVNEQKYIYKEGNNVLTAVADGTENVITLVFREAESWSYTITTSYNENTLSYEATGTVWEDENEIYVQYPRYQLFGSQLVERVPRSNELNAQITVANDNYTTDFAYTAVSGKDNIYLLSEAEELEGTGLSSNATSFTKRVSGGKIIFGSSANLISLPAGKYIVTLGVIGGDNNTHKVNYVIYQGDKNSDSKVQIGSGTCTGNTLYNISSDEITLSETTIISMTCSDPSSSRGIDLIYVQKTGDYVEMADLANGKYYLKNIASGKFWGAGNSWGTQASLLDHPEYVTLAKLNDGKYTMESQVSNGGTAYYFNGDFMDNGSPVSLSIFEGDGYYTIADGSNYFGYDGSTTVLGKNLAADSDNAKWQIYSETEMLATLNEATIDSPVDATFLILDQGFGRNNRNVSAWTMTASNQNLSGGNNVNNNAESFQSTFTLTQTINGAPKGVYALTAQGFYRQDGTDNDNLPYFYIKGLAEETVTFPFKEGSENSMSDASVSFTAGKYKTDAIFAQVGEDGTLEVGAKNPTNTQLWCIFDNFELKYYGDLTLAEVKNSALIQQLADLRQTVTTRLEGDYNDGVKSVLNSALTSTASVESTEEALTAAIATLNSAIDAADAYDIAKPKMANMKVVVDATNLYTADAYNTYYGQWLTKFEAGTLTKAEAVSLQDPSVVTGWHAAVNVDNFLLSVWDTTADDFAGGYYINTWSTEGETDGSEFKVPFFEYWTSESKLTAKTLTATISDLETGNYKATAWVRVSSSSTPAGINMQVGDGKTVDVTNGTKIGESTLYIRQVSAFGTVGDDGVLTVKFNVLDDNTVSWLSFKNVKYEKITLDFDALNDAIAQARTVNASISGGVKSLTDAITAAEAVLNESESQDDIDAATQTLTEAISSAETIIAARLNLAGVAKKVAALKSYLDTDITADVTDASSYANNAEATAADANSKATALLANFCEWEVVTISNGGFDTEADWQTSNVSAGSGKNSIAVTSWNNNGGAAWSSSAAFAYGGTGQINGAAVPSTDMYGKNDGGMLGFSLGWSGVVEYTQTVDLPAGKYVLYYEAYNNNATATIGENHIGLNGTNSSVTNFGNNTWNAYAHDINIAEAVEGATLMVGGKAADAGSGSNAKFVIDNVTIYKVSKLASEAEIAALNDAINAYTLGFQKDEYAPYNNVAGVAALSAAKAIDPSSAMQSDVVSATAAITNATWTVNTEEVNAIFDGTFAAATHNGAPAGWTMSNNTLGGDYHSRAFVNDDRLEEFNDTKSGFYIRFDGTNSNRGSQYFYGNTDGYTMPLKANTYYRVTVDFAGWGSTGKPLRMNVTGPDGFTTVSQQYTTSVQADNANNTPQQFNIVFQTASEGNYVINFQTPGADTNTHAAVISNLRLFTEPESRATLAVTEAKYGTFVAPFDVTMPDGVIAYTVTEGDGSQLTLTAKATEGVELPANTPVVVYSESVVSETFQGYSLATADSYQDGSLVGVYTDTEAPNGSYILQNQNGRVGFYRVDTSKAKPMVRANRAYLRATSGARASFFFEDAILGIDAIEMLTSGEAQVFDVNGVQQPRLKKGLNILRAKDGLTTKVMVK